MFRTVALVAGMCLYVVLSIADWMFTFALLQLEPTASEGNPLASACLDRYGWDGLAIYKACATLVFLVAVTPIALRRPKVAGGVIAVSCSLVFAVTIYSHEMIREIHHERQAVNLAIEDGADAVSPYSRSSLPTPKRCLFPPAEDSRTQASR